MSKTPREKQVAKTLAEIDGRRRRQVEAELEHERFDVRVQRGEWPTHKVGVLFGIDVFTVDAAVPALALMGYAMHNVVTFYDSRKLGPPLKTAQDMMVACDLAAYGCRKQWFVSTAGWRKLRRSLNERDNEPVQSPVQYPTDYVAAPLDRAQVGIDFGTNGDATVTVDGKVHRATAVEIR